MKILYFAASRSLAGASEEEWTVVHPLTEAELWDKILSHHPSLAGIRTSTRLAKNGTYAEKETQFTDSDEVALIPPVSGG